jgi:hypothetical protein
MAATKKPSKGLAFTRKFTRDDVPVFDQFEYDYRTSVIRNPSGEVVFEMNNVEVPKTMEPDCHRYSCPEIFPQSRRTSARWIAGP